MCSPCVTYLPEGMQGMFALPVAVGFYFRCYIRRNSFHALLGCCFSACITGGLHFPQWLPCTLPVCCILRNSCRALLVCCFLCNICHALSGCCILRNICHAIPGCCTRRNTCHALSGCCILRNICHAFPGCCILRNICHALPGCCILLPCFTGVLHS